jgi:hypothetical protein
VTLGLGIPAWGMLSVAIIVAGASFDLVAIIVALIALALIIALPVVPSSVESIIRPVITRSIGRLLQVARVVDRVAPRWLGPALVVAATGTALIAATMAGSPAKLLIGGTAAIALISTGFRVPILMGWSAGALLATIAAHILIVTHTPSDNDVWFLIQGGVEALERGMNPYASCWPVTTDPVSQCAFAYLPMTAFATLPFHAILGDVRYGLLATALVGSAAAVTLAPPRVAVALALLPLPLSVVMVDRSWNEPILAGALGLMVVAVERRALGVAVIALAVALATKQHAALLLPLAAWWPAFGPRRTVLAAVGATAITAPLFLADPGAFISDTVGFLLQLPARADSVSLHALLLYLGIDLPTIVAFGAVAVMIMLCVRFASRSTLGFVAGSAAVLATLNLLGKQSFFNYHALVLVLVAMAIGLAARVLSDMPTGEPIPQAKHGATSPASGAGGTSGQSAWTSAASRS